MKQKSVIFLWIISCFCAAGIFAQELTVDRARLNDISRVSKKFQAAFYEGLTYRLIGNNSKAISEIQNCMRIDSTMPVLYYELAKNQYDLKEYASAEKNIKFALEKMPNEEVLLNTLQEIYFIQNKNDERISVLRKLIEIKPQYELPLARTYFYNGQYSKSLDLLNSYQRSHGYNASVNRLRNRIYVASKDKTPVIIDLEKELVRDNKNEEAYVNLIEVYKGLNKKEEAKKVLARFQTELPDSHLLEYVKFQKYLDEGNTIAATESLTKLTNNNAIEDSLKQRAIQDYRIYGKQNPNLHEELKDMKPSTIGEGNNLKFFMELSSFQIKEGATESLLQIYEKNLVVDPNNFDLIKDTLLLQLYYGKNDQATELADLAIQKYPSQPFLYLISGVLLAKQNKQEKAIEVFINGLDYIVDNPELERALYFKVASSYEVIGEFDKAKKYKSKGDRISIEQN